MLALLRFVLICAFVIGVNQSTVAWDNADPSTKPNRYVGQVITFFPAGNIQAGSGALVAPKADLTAMHCIINIDNKKAGKPQDTWYPMIMMFTPGQRGTRAPYGSANSAGWFYSKDFYNGVDYDKDFGGIALNRQLSTRTGGVAKMGSWPDSARYRIRVVGYNGVETSPIQQTFNAYNELNWFNLKYSQNLFWSTGSIKGRGGCSGGPAFDGDVIRGIFSGVREFWSGPYLVGYRMPEQFVTTFQNWANGLGN